MKALAAGIALWGITLAFASPGFAKGVIGSVHDMSEEEWNTRAGVCSPCHAAHNTDEDQIAPLWSHATSSGPFIPYSSPTMDAAVGDPSGSSLACLSCHDGTVALNASLSNPTPSSPEYIGPSEQVGPDLHTTHPISFVYDSALAAADGYLEDPSTYLIGSPKALSVPTPPVPGTWSGTSLTGKTIDEALLFDGRMECASCHDVHAMEGSAATSIHLLRINGFDADLHGSLLCRTCHLK